MMFLTYVISTRPSLFLILSGIMCALCYSCCSLTRHRCSSFTNCLSVLTCYRMSHLTSRCQPKNFIFHLLKNEPFSLTALLCSLCSSRDLAVISDSFFSLVLAFQINPIAASCTIFHELSLFSVRLILCLYYHNNLYLLYKCTINSRTYNNQTILLAHCFGDSSSF